ncbi:hypothetical protein KBA73_05655 [Patescibacteria group bacterium]|nr:hypothetical protein [Patescibacteria group bacterium]
MFGVILALAWFGYVVFVKDQPPILGYHDSTEFLFYWYALWNGLALGVVGILLGLTTLGVGVSAASGARSGIGKLAGFFGGGALAAGGSILALIIMGLRAAFLVGGAYLMVHATDGAADINHLNNLKAIFGGILIVAALLFFRSSSSKSSSSD